MAAGSSDRLTRCRAAALAAFVALASLCLVFARPGATAKGAAAPQRRAEPRRRGPRAAARAPRRDYSRFSHRLAEHRRQACDSCHKFPSPNWQQARKPGAAFPDVTEYPEHASCLGCHRPQFFASRRPAPQICSVCHTAVTPRRTARHPFPNPREAFDASAKGRAAVSEFGVNFPHDKHLELFAGSRPARAGDAGTRFARSSFSRAGASETQAGDPQGCATCHQTYQPQGDSEDEFVTKPPKDLPEEAFWLKKGTFKTSPRDHAACFNCHAADGGINPAPSTCAACHALPPQARDASLARAHDDFDPKLAAAMGITDKTTLEMWGRRDAARFRHEWPPHDLACAACHDAAAMNTLDETTRRVPVMSCGGDGTGCHVEPTGEGILNLSVARKKADPAFECAKCHVLNGRLPVPETHADAVSATQAK